MKTTIGKFNASIFFLFISFLTISGQQIEKDLPEFDHIVISPYISLKIIEGNKEHIQIEADNIDTDKINIVVKNGKLRVYLDDAKHLPKNTRIAEGKEIYVRELYKDVQVRAVITFRELRSLAIIGEEDVLCQGNINNTSFKLKTIGETKVSFENIEVGKLKIKSIGENEIRIVSGEAISCKTKLIGENMVNMAQIATNKTKCFSIGENEIECNAKEKLRILTIGESEIIQYGKAKIRKGFSIGENEYTYAFQN